MKKIVGITCLFLSFAGIAQKKDKPIEPTVKVVDSLYREDHFYAGVSHIYTMDTPTGYKQNGISVGMQAGFLRDIPVSKDRRWSIAPGVGIAFQSVNNNLFVINPEKSDYEVGDFYKSNGQRYWAIEFPIEFRWRTSTVQSHKFWRIYTGLKYSYIYSYRTKYSGSYGDYTHTQDKNINKGLITAYIVTGFNTWNMQIGYTFTPMYKANTVMNEPSFKGLHLGLMFYIL
ncbi:outer membrane beta-barrel protein [Capnocytophaga sp. ARDL2]|uniref:outer membrane beta-barrel protein n=1 Tax=Capnocytophaga sp. ARDL2 TaxID=3238809 RepID=UPI0035578274